MSEKQEIDLFYNEDYSHSEYNKEAIKLIELGFTLVSFEKFQTIKAKSYNDATNYTFKMHYEKLIFKQEKNKEEKKDENNIIYSVSTIISKK